MALIETYYGPNGPDDKSEIFTADSFLNFIRRSNPVWHEGGEIPDLQHWVYRGHWNSDWRLVPSAGREFNEGNPLAELIKKTNDNLPNDLQFSGKTLNGHLKKCYSFVSAAMHAYNNFTAEAYDLGYINKKTDAHVRDEVDVSAFAPELDLFNGTIIDRTDGRPYRIPYKVQHKDSHFLHLAQHHSIPTFLLDWTITPWTAAHFATNSPPKFRDQHDICVWALNKKAISNSSFSERTVIEKLSENTEFGIFDEFISVNVAKKENEYLAAQDGLFTLVNTDYGIWPSTGRYPCMTDVIEKWIETKYRSINERKSEENEDINRNHTKVKEQAILRKIILPKSEISALRKLLRLEGISRARLMPNLDNVAKDALDQLMED